MATWTERLLADGGPPDLLINNAALMNRQAPLWEQSQDEFDRLIDVNIKGVVNLLRCLLPAMIRRATAGRGEGVVVNISSGWGRSVAPQVAPYCASKWAVEGLTRALAEELPSSMAAVPLNPGIINTDMLRACFGEGASGYSNVNDWAERAVPLLLQLGPKDNGHPLTVPG